MNRNVKIGSSTRFEPMLLSRSEKAINESPITVGSESFNFEEARDKLKALLNICESYAKARKINSSQLEAIKRNADEWSVSEVERKVKLLLEFWTQASSTRDNIRETRIGASLSAALTMFLGSAWNLGVGIAYYLENHMSDMDDRKAKIVQDALKVVNDISPGMGRQSSGYSTISSYNHGDVIGADKNMSIGEIISFLEKTSSIVDTGLTLPNLMDTMDILINPILIDSATTITRCLQPNVCFDGTYLCLLTDEDFPSSDPKDYSSDGYTYNPTSDTKCDAARKTQGPLHIHLILVINESDYSLNAGLKITKVITANLFFTRRRRVLYFARSQKCVHPDLGTDLIPRQALPCY